jgi:hypothetical protein
MLGHARFQKPESRGGGGGSGRRDLRAHPEVSTLRVLRADGADATGSRFHRLQHRGGVRPKEQSRTGPVPLERGRVGERARMSAQDRHEASLRRPVVRRAATPSDAASIEDAGSADQLPQQSIGGTTARSESRVEILVRRISDSRASRLPADRSTNSPVHHFTISPFHHFTISPIHHFTSKAAAPPGSSSAPTD